MNNSLNVERCALDEDPGPMFTDTQALPPAKIGLVEDNPFFAECFATLLEFDGDLDVVFTARDSASLWAGLADTPVDLLIVDLNLGKESGLHLAELVRQSHAKTPIIFISSVSSIDPHDLQRIGHCQFAPKGVHLSDTVSLIRTMIRSTSA